MATFNVYGSLSNNNNYISFHVSMTGDQTLEIYADCPANPGHIHLGDGGVAYIYATGGLPVDEDIFLRLQPILVNAMPAACTGDFRVYFYGSSTTGQQCVSNIEFRESDCSKISGYK